MLEQQEIQTFLTLSGELHFGRTAERLGLTPGRVSQTIKKMERLVGAPLFERTSRQVRLTPLGARLADDLRPHVEGIQDAFQRAVDAGKGVTGVLRVGFLGALAGQLLLKAVAVFAARHPDCEVHIHETQWHDTVSRLLDGDIDVQITDVLFAAQPGLTAGPVLASEPRLLAVPAGHVLAGKDAISVTALADHPLIQVPSDIPHRFQTDRTPSRAADGTPVPQGPRAASFGEALALIAAGQGVFPVGEHAARFYPRPDIAYIPLHDATPIRWGPIWLTTNTSGRLREFVRAAGDTTRPAHP
ncbi:LysR family transcriptional regulator [Streptosporangium lutulentum]|uniref:DNA-binding transcriptional LysR family regulator n=1 Tax=Streptosporangium lutulentum TaxID=1461250 RepID=A0ABT9QSI7_9ACTN|nr:LysR family transcriptional regulator [Streptosporangium lutulentum]MDP9849004.1 DNA-binding transcriptional LysR family regulator [Streptosporangium lutulentum]